MPFTPGLVGGHCIGVDPYYLTHKAQEVGYYPEVILAGQRINDGMGGYVANQLIKNMIRAHINVDMSVVLLMGLTFKENCPDLRNTRIIDIIFELRQFGVRVEVHDPWAASAEANEIYGIELTKDLQPGKYDAVILAVAHDEYRELGLSEIRKLGKPAHLIYDLKSVFDKEQVEVRL